MKLLLSTICILLLALFAYQVMSYPLDDQANQKPTLDKDLAKSIDYDLPRLAVLNKIDDYSAIVKRPLFVKDRAAAVRAQTINNVTTVDELSHLVLVGTASSSDVSIAIVADTKAKQMERIKVGEAYKDWNITEISPDHVIFQNEELEYKLFVTPIKGSQKDKQAKLISQLNKSKKAKNSSAAKSYKGWKNTNKSNSSKLNTATNEQKEAGTGSLWNYRNKSNKNDSSNSSGSKNTGTKSKATKRSPIKIPDEEEKDATYYEAENGDGNSSTASDRESTKRDLSAEDFYSDEDITEEELEALEGLGAKIFDD